MQYVLNYCAKLFYRAIMSAHGWVKSLIMLATSDDVQYDSMNIITIVLFYEW